MTKRKKREGEKTCDCGAYKFPHRMLGGRCEGYAVVAETFDQGLSKNNDCADCHFLVDFNCQVLDGIKNTKNAPCLQDFIRYEGITPPAEWVQSVQFFKGARA